MLVRKKRWRNRGQLSLLFQTEWIRINTPTLVLSYPACFAFQDSLSGIIRGETNSLGWDYLDHRSWILLKYGDKEPYDALSSQLVQMNHGNRPNDVTVTTLVHKLFLKVSTHPAKLTWLGLTFSGSKGGGKTPNMLLDSQEYQQAGDLKTAGTLCSLGELPLHGARQSRASEPSGQLE